MIASHGGLAAPALGRRGRTPLGRARLLVPLVPLAFVVGGCGSPESAWAAEATSRFVTLVADDPAAACDLLAPKTREQVEEEGDGDCAKGLGALELPGSMAAPANGGRPMTEVAGNTARVALQDQSVFLSLFDDGWRVVAAGCTRPSDDPAVPYECVVQGE